MLNYMMPIDHLTSTPVYAKVQCTDLAYLPNRSYLGTSSVTIFG